MTDTATAQDSTAFNPPTAAQLHRQLAAARAWFSPRFFGLDELDLTRPALFVGNHTLFSLDAPLMLSAIYSRHGVLVRALGDHVHFRIPGWGAMVRNLGGVEGTPENCAGLMRQGQSILVFPGGAREVNRRKGEDYQLIWKQRTGFARMAIQHGYDIIPFAAVGPNETFKILVDANDVMDSGIWRWLSQRTDIARRVRQGDLLTPLVRGVGPTLLPRPQRFYFGFGERIATAHLQSDAPDQESLWAVRRQTEQAIAALVSRLKLERLEDHSSWGRARRWLAPLQD